MDDTQTSNDSPSEQRLSKEQARVLGCLMEKESTTPDQYPLSLNSLKLACNQKTSRQPVVSYTDVEVRSTLRTLESMQLVRELSVHDSRVPKYEHRALKYFDISSQDLAVLCVLMLRGPQTLSEIKTRTQRIHEFSSLDDCQRVLQRLIDREQPFVKQLERQVGQKEVRYQQLVAEEEFVEQAAPAVRRSTPQTGEISELKQEVDELKSRLTALEKLVEELTS